MDVKEIGENTIVGLSLKTLGSILAAAIMIAVGYFDLKADVAEAKKLPEPEIGRTEYDLKDELVRGTIFNTQKDVEEIKAQLDKMEERLFELR